MINSHHLLLPIVKRIEKLKFYFLYSIWLNALTFTIPPVNPVNYHKCTSSSSSFPIFFLFPFKVYADYYVSVIKKRIWSKNILFLKYLITFYLKIIFLKNIRLLMRRFALYCKILRHYLKRTNINNIVIQVELNVKKKVKDLWENNSSMDITLYFDFLAVTIDITDWPGEFFSLSNDLSPRV